MKLKSAVAFSKLKLLFMLAHNDSTIIELALHKLQSLFNYALSVRRVDKNYIKPGFGNLKIFQTIHAKHTGFLIETT